MENLLNKIIINKKENILKFKKKYTINELLNNILNVKNLVNFNNELKKRDINNKISIHKKYKK